MIHLQRFENIFLNVFLIRLARNDLDKQAQHCVVRTAVLEITSNRTIEVRRAEIPHAMFKRSIAHISTRSILLRRLYGDTACVVEQLSHGDIPRGIISQCEPGNILADLGVQFDLALLNQLHYRQSCK